MPAPTLLSFDYAIIRVVPQVERGECLNAGVALFCRVARFLDARLFLDSQRLAVLAPDFDQAELTRQLEHLLRIIRGEREAGPIAALPPSERFHWLVAPRSTVIQTSPVHSGLTANPAATLDHLLRTLVLPPPPRPHP
ncbi:MAG TPA: DUF3037 domain-containing protein [Thermomicrobiaceae bacterium]|nr:DUF3037 domain-containing protein [Thermomicrobiaceae bacterium]